MGRASKNAAIDSKAKRLKLPISREPHWFKIDDGKHLGYRKTGDAQGTWIVRTCKREDGKQFRTFTPLGIADDGASFGSNVLSYSEAIKAAGAELKKIEHADKAGVKHKESYTVAEALTDYIAEKEREKRKPQDRARQIADAHISSVLGKIALQKLTHGKVKAWRDALAAQAPRIRTKTVKEKRIVTTMLNGEEVQRVRERATDKLEAQAYRDVDMDDPAVQRQRQASANRILTVLKAALNFAHQERKVASKEAWDAVKPFRKVDVPKIRFLSSEEVAELIPHCEDSFRKLVQGALVTGCRYGELTAMSKLAFEPENGRVYVAESKNGEARYVDLNDEGVAFFAAQTAGRADFEPIFLKANGKPWMKSEQKRPIDAACEASKIEGVTFHILRHTYASHAVMNGVPIAVLSEQLGHKDTRITERHYAHLSKTYKRKLIRENAPSFGFMPVAAPGPQLMAKAG
jgi:integrase